jgi:hypothetical protein
LLEAVSPNMQKEMRKREKQLCPDFFFDIAIFYLKRQQLLGMTYYTTSPKGWDTPYMVLNPLIDISSPQS